MHPLLATILERGRQRQPLIGAHRGASARAPENTLAAFRAALDDRAELIELDVHVTRDGRLAVIHDETTGRTTGVDGVVAKLTMAELRALDAGRVMGGAWAGEPAPELGDVFALARGRVPINVEIKGGMATLPVLIACLEEHGMMESVIVSSFDAAIVRAATALRPSLLAGLLVDEPVSDPLALARAIGAALLHVEHSAITAELVALLHQAGLGALAWTANDPVEMRRVQALGVDAMLSDDPLLLRQTIG